MLLLNFAGAVFLLVLPWRSVARLQGQGRREISILLFPQILFFFFLKGQVAKVPLENLCSFSVGVKNPEVFWSKPWGLGGTKGGNGIECLLVTEVES